jgi:hypothetical protein
MLVERRLRVHSNCMFTQLIIFPQQLCLQFELIHLAPSLFAYRIFEFPTCSVKAHYALLGSTPSVQQYRMFWQAVLAYQKVPYCGKDGVVP